MKRKLIGITEPVCGIVAEVFNDMNVVLRCKYECPVISKRNLLSYDEYRWTHPIVGKFMFSRMSSTIQDTHHSTPSSLINNYGKDCWINLSKKIHNLLIKQIEELHSPANIHK